MEMAACRLRPGGIGRSNRADRQRRGGEQSRACRRPRGGFGEILHTPVLLARAGKSVELSYDVVCGALKDEPGSHCSPSGSVFVRPVGGSTFAKLPLEREADGLLSAVVPAGDAGRVRLLRRDGRRAGSHRDAARGRRRGAAARLDADDWTTVDVGAAHFGHSRAPSSVVRELLMGSRRRRDRARQRPRAVAHRAVCVRRRARRLGRSARPGQPQARSAATRGSTRSCADRVLGRRGRPRRGRQRNHLRARLVGQAHGSSLHGRGCARSRPRGWPSRRRT